MDAKLLVELEVLSGEMIRRCMVGCFGGLEGLPRGCVRRES